MIEVNGFQLMNDAKLNIAADGNGNEFKGVGREDLYALAVEYDKRGGLIMKDGVKQENGVFWDFEKKCARTEPKAKAAKAPKATMQVETTDGEEAVKPRGRRKKQAE